MNKRDTKFYDKIKSKDDKLSRNLDSIQEHNFMLSSDMVDHSTKVDKETYRNNG